MELRAKELKITRSSLGETDEVLVVGVHVGQLDVYQQQHLNLRRLKKSASYTRFHQLDDVQVSFETCFMQKC